MAESNNSKSNKITLKIFIPEDPSVQATLSPVDGEKNKLDCLELNIGSSETEGHIMAISDKTIFNVNINDISFNDIDRLQPYALRNHTQTLRLVQSASLQYRLGHFSWRLSGSINYYKVQNSINKAAERETFDYAIRANLQSDLPFDMQISTNINYLSRHGYSSNIVKNRAIWNAQLTKRLFAHDAGLLSLQVFDLLHQRTNVNRSISGLTITDTHSMVLGSYFLASFQYRINTMRRGQRGQRWQRGSQQRQRNGYNRPQSGSRPPGNRTNGSRNGRK